MNICTKYKYIFNYKIYYKVCLKSMYNKQGILHLVEKGGWRALNIPETLGFQKYCIEEGY